MRPPPPVRRSKGPRNEPRLVGDLLGGALRQLGVPSQALGEKIRRAWGQVLEDAWRGRTRLESLEGGVLTVAVASAPLRDELENFHRTRLLDVMRVALPDVPLVGLRFVADSLASPTAKRRAGHHDRKGGGPS
jgi:hypothetical protein